MTPRIKTPADLLSPEVEIYLAKHMIRIIALEVPKEEKILEIERMVNYLQINIDDSKVAEEHKTTLSEVRRDCRNWLTLTMMDVLERREGV